MIVTSFNDVTVILLTQMKGLLYKGACMSPGGSSLVHLVLFQILPLVHSQEATDPLSRLPWCLLRSRIITIQGSVLYLFNCMCSRLS